MKTPALVYLALVGCTAAALAVTPPPGGGYPGANTALGDDALFSLTTGFDNTAIGSSSLYNNTSGFTNVALGNLSLYNNKNGIDNLALGYAALIGNTSGSANIGIGDTALFLNQTGSFNLGVGNSALYKNFTGSNNVAIGQQALCQLNGGSNNIALGLLAGESLTSGDNNIIIGHDGVGVESGAIRLGTNGTQKATYIAGIVHTGVANGVAVGISPSGQLGVRPGAARFQENTQPMARASEALFSLRPVTFRYKKELDAAGIRQFGLVADEVARVAPDLVARDEQGQPFTVRPEAVNAMLLNEFLKEHQKVQSLEATVQQLQAALQAQATQIQKVSAQMQTAHAQ